MGVMSGTIGINYSHELMHQKNRLERWLGDLLLATVLYSHFRTEHLLVHHLYVGTPRDAVTARYNEGFHRFFLRVLRESPGFRPFGPKRRCWRARACPGRIRRTRSGAMGAAGALMLGLRCCWAAGRAGVVPVLQAATAVWQLELTNYIEHYGLTRRHLGEGKYEHTQPRHSWNASHKATNWLLINLQRHSDHHYKPDRRFPLLQTYDTRPGAATALRLSDDELLALIPPLWRRMMNPKVRAWRRQFYPDITDWQDYNKARTRCRWARPDGLLLVAFHALVAALRGVHEVHRRASPSTEKAPPCGHGGAVAPQADQGAGVEKTPLGRVSSGERPLLPSRPGSAVAGCRSAPSCPRA
jgi:alkane 1-monooxygenase